MLYRFIDLFPSFIKFQTEINKFLFFSEIPNDEMMQKLYRNLFAKYKGYFFRWMEIASIYNEIAAKFEVLFKEYELLVEISENVEKTVSETNLNENFERDNTVDDSTSTDLNFKTNQSKTTNLSGKDIIKQKEKLIKQTALLNNFIRDFRNLFRLYPDENVLNITYNK